MQQALQKIQYFRTLYHPGVQSLDSSVVAFYLRRPFRCHQILQRESPLSSQSVAFKEYIDDRRGDIPPDKEIAEDGSHIIMLAGNLRTRR